MSLYTDQMLAMIIAINNTHINANNQVNLNKKVKQINKILSVEIKASNMCNP